MEDPYLTLLRESILEAAAEVQKDDPDLGFIGDRLVDAQVLINRSFEDLERQACRQIRNHIVRISTSQESDSKEKVLNLINALKNLQS